MELYHKQLNSVAELRREKKRLKKAHIEAEKQSVVDDVADDNPLASVADIANDFFTSKGSLNAMMSLAMPLFRLALRKTEKGVLKKVATEVIGGYLKWKGIDLGIRLAMRFIRMQKHKADKEHPDRD